MNNSKKRIITDCAVCAAITVILTAVAMYVPSLGFITYFLCGTPVAYTVFKYGCLSGVLTALCAAAAMLLGVNANTANIGLVFVAYILPTFAFSVIYKRFGENGFYSALCCTAVIYLVLGTVFVYVLNGDGNGIRDMLTASADSMTQSLKQSLSAAYVGDISSLDNALSDAVEMTVDTILRYMPTILICASAISAYILIMINIFVIKRFGGADIKYPPFCSITGTRTLCMLTMLTYIVAFISDEKKIVGITAANAASVLTALFAICGLSATDFILASKIKSGYARGAIYGGIVIGGFLFMGLGLPILSLAVEIMAFIGFFDSMNSMRSFIFFVSKNTNIYHSKAFKNPNDGNNDNKNMTDDRNDDDRSENDGNYGRRQ